MEELRKLKDKLFGRRSEKWSAEEQLQGLLFNEAELACGETRKEGVEEPGITVKSYTRRRGKRKPLPAELPREEIIHDILEEEKQCACGHEKVVIGREESEKLDIIPMQVKVLKHIRLKYACKHCEGTEEEGISAVTIAPPAPQLLPKTMATPGLCAYLITSKYCDALPLYRLEKLFSRGGVDLPRETMGRWMIKIASLLSGLIDLLEEAIKKGPVQLMDETRLQVLGEDNRSNTSLSFLWVALGGRPDTPAVRFMYHQSRSGKVAKSWLSGYQGFVQTDGYEGYDAACSEPGIIHVGCFAHVRRRFMDALKSSGKSKQAAEALNYIKKL